MGLKLTRLPPPAAFRRGDRVRVRTATEILLTLDDRGDLEGMPFMPEMIEQIGREATVTAQVERGCDTIQKSGSRRLPGTVLLDDMRCGGEAHAACDAGCRFYWKDAWLAPASTPAATVDEDEERAARAELLRRTTAATSRPDAEAGTLYRCQATQFVEASQELGWWNLSSFFREGTCGNVPWSRWAFVMARIVVDEVARRAGLLTNAPVKPTGPEAESRWYGLEPGDRVRIRPLEQIATTLDEGGKTRGLWFDREMAPFCGKEATVKRRVRQFVDDRTGKLVVLKTDCVILDGVFCKGEISEGRWFCPRAIYPWWRETWLEPVEAEAARPTNTP